MSNPFLRELRKDMEPTMEMIDKLERMVIVRCSDNGTKDMAKKIFDLARNGLATPPPSPDSNGGAT